MAEHLTKSGFRMREWVRKRVVEVLADGRFEGVRQEDLAKRLGMGARTFRDYLTPEVWAEVEARRVRAESPTLADVDRAMLVKASEGNVAAARLVYARLAGMEPQEALPSLEELEEAVRKLRQEALDGKAGV